MNKSPRHCECDIAVIGGALSGAATALMLKQRDPSLKVIVIEKEVAFKRRVGEATVEVAAYFFCRVLGLTQFLTQTQLAKNGLRFWFSNEACKSVGDCSEIGGKYLSTVPSFLVDRAVMDEEVLLRAIEIGVEVWRPASVSSVQLTPGNWQQLQVDHAGEDVSLRARWVVDASGIKCMLSRTNGWWQRFEEHPTLSAWSRWRNVEDWDAKKLTDLHPELGRDYVGIRGTATNHLVGDGWWAWWIQLKGGDTSIGVVVDPRKTEWPSGNDSIGEKLRTFLSRHAAAKEMLRDAEFVSGDVHYRRNMPYRSTVFAGDGFVLVGDAAAFLDPFYSPGMDWIAFSSSAAVRTIMTWRKNKDLTPVLKAHNRDFTKSFRCMFEGLYEDKYDYLGDYELMRVAFHLDLAFYYLFVARPIFAEGPELLVFPPYSVKEAAPILAIMRLYNRRLAAMGRHRRKRGCFGRHNNGHRDLFSGLNFKVTHLLKIISSGLILWTCLEITEAWKSWLHRKRPSPNSPDDGEKAIG